MVFSMSNDKKIYNLFIGLLPEVEIFTQPEPNLEDFFKSVCQEFVRFLDFLASVSSSLPDQSQGILAPTWQEIFASQNLLAKSAEFGLVLTDRRTSPIKRPSPKGEGFNHRLKPGRYAG